MLLGRSKRRWGPHAFIKQRSITSRHNTKPTQNTTHTKKLPMILDSAKVLALSWGASQWACQRRSLLMGPSADYEELVSWHNWSRGWNLHLRQSAGFFFSFFLFFSFSFFWRLMQESVFKKPLSVCERVTIKKNIMEALFFKMWNIRHMFTLKLQNKNERA